MPGTREGGIKAAKIVKLRYGEDFYTKIGRIGGQVKGPKGFAVTGLAAEAGRKGGRISKRKKRVEPF